MKKLMLIFAVVGLLATTADANPFHKNKKAHNGDMKSNSTLVTAPRTETQSPFVKNNGISLDMGNSLAVVNPEVIKETGPKVKNQKHFNTQQTPSIEIGRLEMAKAE